MYLSSTSAQVVAALFGLTVTGYIFLDEKLKMDIEKDDSLFDIIEELKVRYRKQLIFIGILSVIAIFSCIANIALGIHNVLLFKAVNNYILCNSVISSVITICAIILFAFEVVDPKKVSKASAIAQKEMDKNTQENEVGDLALFLKTYNEIEKMIRDKADSITGIGDHKNTPTSMYQNLKILLSSEVISGELFEKLNQLRRYRNYVVHGSEMIVTKRICQDALELNKELQ